MTDTSDPILVQRRIVGRRVSIGLRVGSLLFLAATLFFAWAIITDFTKFTATAITLCLLLGSLILAPAMVFHYGVKAADRADREDSW